jgi:RNA-binding protein YlmH
MTSEDKILIARYEDKANQCGENSMITCTPFLDMRERSVIASHLVSKSDAKTVFYGIFEDAERTTAVMLPYYIEADDFESLCSYFKDNHDDNPLAVIEVEKDRFSPPLSHRDYLGALMSLGIRREITGDIVVNENGCRIAVLSHMAQYVAENLCKAGRGSLKTKILSPCDCLLAEKPTAVEDSFTVSSLRLDSVVKNAFRVSRSDAVAAIESGLVFINDSECLKADKKISEGDKIVFRRKGRIIVRDCSSVSKKGRIIVIINKFI